MKKQKKKELGKKPFLVLTRRAIAAWIFVIFVISAWMFGLGVWVGRGTVPVKFDVAKLQEKLKGAGGTDTGAKDSERKKESALKDETKLDFYEALPQNREDTKVPELKKPKAPATKTAPETKKKKVAPPKAKSAQPAKKNIKPEPKVVQKTPPKKAVATVAKASPATKKYTIQVASVKTAEDADRLVAGLKKRGYASYRVIAKVPNKGIWFRVRVGHYSSKADAARTLAKLKTDNMKPIIVEK
jgi:cell division protein FtsN